MPPLTTLTNISIMPPMSPPSSGTTYLEEEDVPIRPPSRNWPVPLHVEETPLPLPKEWSEDVVISGISGRYPESNNLTEFWEKLISGVELVSCDGRRWPVGECIILFYDDVKEKNVSVGLSFPFSSSTTSTTSLFSFQIFFPVFLSLLSLFSCLILLCKKIIYLLMSVTMLYTISCQLQCDRRCERSENSLIVVREGNNERVKTTTKSPFSMIEGYHHEQTEPIFHIHNLHKIGTR